MTDPFASPEPFRKWLEGFEPRQIIGSVCTPSGCPVTNYLLATGLEDVRVIGVAYSFLVSPPHDYQHDIGPPWLGVFVSKIDQLGKIGRPIQARTALRILKKVTQ